VLATSHELPARWKRAQSQLILTSVLSAHSKIGETMSSTIHRNPGEATSGWKGKYVWELFWKGKRCLFPYNNQLLSR
jgi:hypothetical protein